MATVLVVDDDAQFRDSVTEMLELLGHETRSAGCVAEARERLEAERFDLVILDFVLPDGSGMGLLDTLSKAGPRRIAVVTGATGVQETISRISGPQLTFALKPIDADVVKRLVAGLDEDDGETEPELRFGEMIGDSPAIGRVYEHIERVAPVDVAVLILGESGTGKELVARSVHSTSRRTGDFVAVNCGAFNRELIGSELFGHEKGAFTGAAARRAGCFERAAEGTLFLDEITEMPIDLQPTFLRVLESGRYVRVGGQQEHEASCRIVAATNRDPREAVAEGALREDLLFRLAEFTIDVPPLRERAGDLRLLADVFLDDFAPEGGTLAWQEEDHAALAAYDWPGNVRELRHVVQRAVLLRDLDSGRPALAEALSHAATLTGSEANGGIEPGRSIAEVERDLIETTLAHFDGDKKKTAETLGVSLKTLYNRLKTYAADD